LTGSDNQWRLFIGDGSNEAYIDFSAQNPNTWEERTLSFSSMTDIGLLDLSNIQSIKIQLRNVSSTTTGYFNYWTSTTTCYFDFWTLVGGAGHNSTVIRLYDFGSTANPTTLGTQMPQDYDVLEVPIDLSPNKRVHQVHLHLGSHELDESLVVGNYYGLYITKPDAGVLNIYGSEDQVYQSGKCYSDTDGSLMEIPGTLGFMVMSAIEARLSEISVVPDANAGSSKTFLFVNDMLTGETIFFSEITLEESGQHLVMKDTLPEYIWTSQTTRLSIYYQDGTDSRASVLTCRPKFYYNTIAVYG
jgi:hypothetical protein